MAASSVTSVRTTYDSVGPDVSSAGVAEASGCATAAAQATTHTTTTLRSALDRRNCSPPPIRRTESPRPLIVVLAIVVHTIVGSKTLYTKTNQ
ncbi:hypothetical protein NY08_4630 [Rhodococcus sp. B7740]|nr:hypothetical protein NY08_4630 [Rhodococcus sp. B7740]